MYVEYDKTSVYCYKIIYPYEIKEKKLSKKQLLPIVDYTGMEEQLYIYKTPQYTIQKYKKIFIGHDTNQCNENPLFGFGNTLLVVDQKNKVYFIQDKVIQLNHIKGNIQGYISPVGNNDVPYPMIFTSKYVYDWCENFAEHHVPQHKDDKMVIHELCKIYPLQNIRHKRKINTFLTTYECSKKGKKYLNMQTVLYDTDE